MSDYLYDRSGDDPEVAELEGLLGAYAHRAPLRDPPLREPPRRRRWLPAMTAGVAVTAAAAIFVLWPRGGATCQAAGPGFAFAVEGGPARCSGSAASRGTLPVGAWLETSTRAVADVRVADIGKLTVYGDSRVRLVDTGAAGHRLELARGKVSARVTAPPRLFVIDTPVAAAVDLGCAYELVVDADGRTHLRVTLGAVSLEGRGYVAYAPMGTEVLAVPGRGPGTPVATGASERMRAAVTEFDGGDAGAVRSIVDAAEGRDTATLWNLLSRTTAGDRATVIARLEQLADRPAGVRTDDVQAGDPAAIERWRQALVARWMCPSCFPAGTKR
jgi:hypothetical protein